MTSKATLVPVLEAKLVASDASPQSYFASALALDGDTAIIGAYGASGSAGAAYVFGRAGDVWSQQQKLVASDSHAFGDFGLAVALSGDRALVGAPEYLKSSAVYVFARKGGVWSEEARLVASDPGPDDQFGSTVALAGDTAFIGAPNANMNAGAVYVFSIAGGVWMQTSKLTVAGSTSFGVAVAADGDNLVVGDTHASYAFAPSGGTWVQTALLWPSTEGQSGAPGLDIAVSGDTAVVVSGAGHPAHVFSNTGGAWGEQGAFELSTGVYTTPFISVSLSGDTCVLGVSKQDQLGQVGSAHVFARNKGAWASAADIAAPAGAERDGFGSQVSLSGDTALVGAYWGQGQAGAAYVYTLQLEEPPPDPQRVLVDGGCAYTGAPPGALGAVLVAVALAALARRVRCRSRSAS